MAHYNAYVGDVLIFIKSQAEVKAEVRDLLKTPCSIIVYLYAQLLFYNSINHSCGTR